MGKVILRVSEGIQVPPKLLNFKTFQKVLVCDDCDYTISHEDFINEYEPCPNCGGRFSGIKSFIGIWDKNKKAWSKQ